MEKQSKLDQFKRLLVREIEEEAEEMAIKLEKDDLEYLMVRVMATAMAAKEGLNTSAQVGEEVNVVATQPLKIAGFWEDDPETWFLCLERQFHTRKITSDETKFSHVVQALAKAQTKEIRSVLRNPPKDASYETIKKPSPSHNSRKTRNYWVYRS